jgi:hypothetical protein
MGNGSGGYTQDVQEFFGKIMDIPIAIRARFVQPLENP